MLINLSLINVNFSYVDKCCAYTCLPHIWPKMLIKENLENVDESVADKCKVIYGDEFVVDKCILHIW